MLTPDLFRFLHKGGALRQYRRALHESIAQEPVTRLCPSLLTLPLLMPVADRLPEPGPRPRGGPAGPSVQPALSELLQRQRAIVVRGPTGSGRSLALLQLAWHWAAGNGEGPVLLLSLAHADALNLTPRSVLASAMHATGLPSPLNGAAPTAAQSWLLLIDDWESLPEHRRDAWRMFLLDLPRLWPQARLVLAAPADGPDWPAMEPVSLGSPDDALLSIWLAHLLPRHLPDPLLAALGPGGHLATLRERLVDVALLALTYPIHAMPCSRAMLYEQAYPLVRAVLPEPMPIHDPLSAARPPALIPAKGPPSAGMTTLHRYLTARAMAADLPKLLTLDPPERAEVALLLNTMLPDPAPLYALLWGPHDPAAADLQLLARCLLERRPGPAWELRVLSTLADRAADPACLDLLRRLAAQAPAIVVQAAGDDPGGPHVAAALGLVAALVALGADPLIGILDAPGALPELRWAAADALLNLGPGAASAPLLQQPPPDQLSQAARCSILAACDPAALAGLDDDTARAWIAALRREPLAGERRGSAARGLLAAQALSPALRAAALELLPPEASQPLWSTILAACADPDSLVRAHAFAALRAADPRQAPAHLAQLLLAGQLPLPVCYDALAELAGDGRGEASLLLARCALAPQLPLAARLSALELLARRPTAGPLLLAKLLAAPAADPPVRAAAALLAGKLGAAGALPALCQAAAGDGLPATPGGAMVRRAAVAALGLLAGHPVDRAPLRAALAAILDCASDDSELMVAAIVALGQAGDASSIPALRSLLSADIASQLQITWLNRAPQLAALPAAEWTDLPMAGAARVDLLTIMVGGDTDADPPSSLGELIEHETTRVRRAAVLAMAAIARRDSPQLGHAVRAALRMAVRAAGSLDLARGLLDGIACAGGAASLADFYEILADPDILPTVRWLAAEQIGELLAANADGAGIVTALLHLLEHDDLEPFIGGKLAQVLSRARPAAALPVLRQLAMRPDVALHLRREVIAALGEIADPAAEATLVEIAASPGAAMLRGAAAEAIPAAMSAETRHLLRELLRRERQSPELTAGVLRCLGRARDREALSLMLRYAQSDNPAEAGAALTAITAIGDPSVAPALVRVTQSTSVDQYVRLHAVGTLLTLSGEEYLPLLRNYLDAPALPLRVRAFDYLMELRPDDPYPLSVIHDRTGLIMLRLRALEVLATRPDGQRALGVLLRATDDDPQLRARAARALGQAAGAELMEALAAGAGDPAAPPRLRYSCIASLGAQIRGTGAGALLAAEALSQLASDRSQPAETRTWAARALIDAGIA